MPPTNQQGPPAPQQHPDYDFIMSAQKQQQKFGGGSPGLQDPRKRMIISVAFVVGVLLIVFVGFSIITSVGGTDADDLKRLAAQQTEISRIADEGLKEASIPDTLNQVTTLKSIIDSDLRDTLGYLSRNGVTPTPVELASAKSSAVDEALASAATRNNYDDELIDQLNTLITAYKLQLNSALNTTTSSAPNRQNLLNGAATNILTYEGQELSSDN